MSDHTCMTTLIFFNVIWGQTTPVALHSRSCCPCQQQNCWHHHFFGEI